MNRRWKIVVAFVVQGFFSVGVVLAQSGPATIEVKVEVAEVDNTKASNLGVQWLDPISIKEAAVGGLVEVGRAVRGGPLQADVHLLMEEGAAELLANPNLITDSNTTATFHAGGEIPYLTSTSLGTTNVEFKRYGVVLEIRPQLLENGWIDMNIKASVSSPDQSNGVVLSGNTVPALFERQVTSNVTLPPNTTVTLAGLLQTQKEEKAQGVPVLRRIPILGALFRWRRTYVRRTTVIMFVTPSMLIL